MHREERLLTIREAAERLGLREGTLRVWLRRRKLTRVHLGGAVRIPESAVDDLIAHGTVSARLSDDDTKAGK